MTEAQRVELSAIVEAHGYAVSYVRSGNESKVTLTKDGRYWEYASKGSDESKLIMSLAQMLRILMLNQEGLNDVCTAP